jgi:hypothetical protein
METAKMNLTEAQEKIFKAFMKAFGISRIHKIIGDNIFAEALRENEMKFTGTINSETYVNCEGTGLIGKELCSEYSDARGRKFWYVFDACPLEGDVYIIFETAKPRSQKVLKSTINTYEMLWEVLHSSEEELKRFWRIETEEETPWDAMRVRLWKFLHPINA